jgi:flavin-dependent dehydrogenase
VTDYDVIIVGGRVAGAGTALLLARAGYRVLVVDRCRRGSDTLSTHALMRPAVLQLQRWGLLDAVADVTPAQERVVFHYGDDRVRLEVSRPLYAPRRTVLDPIIAAAAERAGATLWYGVDVRGLRRDGTGRVIGVRLRDGDGRIVDLRAPVTVGADGRRSLVARDAGATVTRAGSGVGASVYGYWTGIDAAGFEWGFRPGRSSGLIPTNDGLVCVFASVPAARFQRELRHDVTGGLYRVLAETSADLAARVAGGTQVERVRAYPGTPAWLRRPWGPGWALVGDAGYFKDPTTAHGISDALRDAELLAAALADGRRGDVAPAVALARYERVRDELSIPLFEITDALAGFRWDLTEAQRLHLAMSRELQREVDALAALPLPRSAGIAA